MKKQTHVTKEEFDRVELMLTEHTNDAITILMTIRELLLERTILLSDQARALVLNGALYYFLKSICFNDANYDEDKSVTQRNISGYEEFADEIIGNAFFEMCQTLNDWRPPQSR